MIAKTKQRYLLWPAMFRPWGSEEGGLGFSRKLSHTSTQTAQRSVLSTLRESREIGSDSQNNNLSIRTALCNRDTTSAKCKGHAPTTTTTTSKENCIRPSNTLKQLEQTHTQRIRRDDVKTSHACTHIHQCIRTYSHLHTPTHLCGSSRPVVLFTPSYHRSVRRCCR